MTDEEKYRRALTHVLDKLENGTDFHFQVWSDVQKLAAEARKIAGMPPRGE